jgi:hypothetical protein
LADQYDESWERVRAAVLDSEGVLPHYVRRAIERGEDPPEFAALLEKVRQHAYRIVDADVAGLDVDVVYEIVLAAAVGEGEARREAALKAIG